MIRLNCCEFAYYYIELCYHDHDTTDKDYFMKNKPGWSIKGAKMSMRDMREWIDKYETTTVGNVTTIVGRPLPSGNINYCSCCGEELPDIKMKDKLPDKVTSIEDGGYYCATCDGRLNECTRPPEMWELAE